MQQDPNSTDAAKKQDFTVPNQEELGTAQQATDPVPPPDEKVEREIKAELNFEIPIAVARICWPHDPAAGDAYVQSTAPILDLIEFHKCLGPMGDLPPTARLIIGAAVIVGGVVVIKIGQQKKGGPGETKGKEEVVPGKAGERGKGKLPVREEDKVPGAPQDTKGNGAMDTRPFRDILRGNRDTATRDDN